MTDIVERLRDRNAVVLSGLFHAIPTMQEAANEIERLNAIVLAHIGNENKLYAENRSLRALVEEARTALMQWKCAGCGGSGKYQQDAKGRARAEARGRKPDPKYQPEAVTCKVCKGDGLNPIASAALSSK